MPITSYDDDDDKKPAPINAARELNSIAYTELDAPLVRVKERLIVVGF